MRDCVRRFAEAMDAMMTEKDEEKEGTCRNIDVYELLDLAEDHVFDALDLIHASESCKKHTIHAANYCMMAWNRMVI